MANDLANATLIPEICVHDARGAIAFYEKAFGAKDLGTHTTPDGKMVMHAALAMNGGVVFVCDDFPHGPSGKARSPKALGDSNVTIHLNCVDVQKAWDVAVRAGATVAMPLEKQFWGDTYGILVDPFGQRWSMSGAKSQKTDESSAEYEKGAKKLYPTAGGAKPAKKKAGMSSAKGSTKVSTKGSAKGAAKRPAARGRATRRR
jgi:PhnB protein